MSAKACQANGIASGAAGKSSYLHVRALALYAHHAVQVHAHYSRRPSLVVISILVRDCGRNVDDLLGCEQKQASRPLHAPKDRARVHIQTLFSRQNTLASRPDEEALLALAALLPSLLLR